MAWELGNAKANQSSVEPLTSSCNCNKSRDDDDSKILHCCSYFPVCTSFLIQFGRTPFMVRSAFLFQQLPVLPSPDPIMFCDDSHVLSAPLESHLSRLNSVRPSSYIDGGLSGSRWRLDNDLDSPSRDRKPYTIETLLAGFDSDTLDSTLGLAKLWFGAIHLRVFV
ncbi:hypothetical protein BDZ97DRAFT_2061934 [Flammula alnicola]|nr:hypothetical protein BDZ97DRAFT_2061934 [Flammula alnicola]